MKQPVHLLALFALFAVPIPAPAQSAAFTYQGRLVDAGQPADGNYDLRFALTDAAIGGNQIGPALTNAPVTVSNGYFMVTLDFAGTPFDGAARWLQIGVRTNGSVSPYTLLSPRQPITATPYATFANAAATAAVAANLTPGAAIVANGAGITNLSGANIAPGTVNSSALNATTWLLATQQVAALVVAAGTNVTIQTNGGVYTVSATGGGMGTVTNLLSGANAITPIMGAFATINAAVYDSLDTNLIGTYTFQSVAPLYEPEYPELGGVTNWVKAGYQLSCDSQWMYLSHPVLLYSNGVAIRYSDNGDGPGGPDPAWRYFLYMNGSWDTNSLYGMESNSIPVG